MPRLPRNKRVKKPPPMRLMQRDIEVIKAIHDYRVLKSDQIQELFFGSQSTASYRLTRLFQHEYLDRNFLPTLGGLASSPILYALGKRGADILFTHYGLAREDLRRKLGKKELSPMFLEHILQINEFRIAVTLAAKEAGYSMETWLDDAELKSDYDYVTVDTPTGRKAKVSLIPDSYFTLEVPQGRASFFLELDRGTMTLGRFQQKILTYKKYFSSGQYQRRYKTKSLRVLTITVSEKRLQNLKRKADEVDGGRVFWFTTLDQVRMDLILNTPIWHIAGQKQAKEALIK